MAPAQDSPGWPQLLGMGLTVAVIVAVGMAAGWLLDDVLSTSPTLVIVGLLVGIVAAIWFVVEQFRKFLHN